MKKQESKKKERKRKEPRRSRWVFTPLPETFSNQPAKKAFPSGIFLFFAPVLACVAGVERGRGRGRGNLGARESAPHTFSRAPKYPPSPSPFNAGHAGYSRPNFLDQLARKRLLRRLFPNSMIRYSRDPEMSIDKLLHANKRRREESIICLFN